MSDRVPARMLSAFREMRPRRLLALLVLSLLAAVISDWVRHDRVIFPAPLPKFVTVPAGR